MRTKRAKESNIKRRWWVVDAEGIPLGRLASNIAKILSGKHRPDFTPEADTGDFVVVINAGALVLTGRKAKLKMWRRHSGIPGGYKETPYGELLQKDPKFVIEKAVKGMLPKGSLGRRKRSKLKVYATSTHPHSAQKPEALSIH
ncbi:MAG: 50S ribosomal protein L13 [Myxococcota bacterium]